MEITITIHAADLMGQTLQEALANALGTAENQSVAVRLAQHIEERDQYLAEDAETGCTDEDAGYAHSDRPQDAPAAASYRPAEPNTPPQPAPSRPAPPPGIQVDEAGTPWFSEIHNSNKKTNKSGPRSGRWMWKRGIDKDEAEKREQELCIEYFNRVGGQQQQQAPVAAPEPAPEPAAPPAGPTPENAAPVADNAVPAAENAAPPAGPSPENATPPAAENTVPPPGNAQPGQRGGSWIWPKFLAALDNSGIPNERVLEVAKRHGAGTLHELSTAAHDANRARIAEELGLTLPW